MSAPPPPASMMRKNRPFNLFLSKFLQNFFRANTKNRKNVFHRNSESLMPGVGGIAIPRGFVIFSRADASDIFKVFTGCDNCRPKVFVAMVPQLRP